MPKIYGFVNGGNGVGDVAAIAVAEDGEVVASHISSNEGWARSDLGMGNDNRTVKHDLYAEKYPDGYELEFVMRGDIESHAGLQAVFRMAEAEAS